MFGRAAQQQKRIETLEATIRDLDGLVAELADRAGISGEELERLRGEVGPAVPAECRELVADGRHIEAIKVYRQRTGAGLKEAKDAIDHLRA